jgi:cation diffusion facilitator family transporter
MDPSISRNAYEKKIIVKVSIWTMVFNTFLAIMKIFAGIVGKSSAIISDAVNSISDVTTALAVMIIGRFSRKDKDIDHQYGHEKYESMASVFLGVALFLTAFEIGKSGVMTIYEFFRYGTAIIIPNYVALVCAVLTIVIKEGMYRYTRHNAKKANSPALEAMAWDHRSDELASSGAIIGIVGTMIGATIPGIAGSLLMILEPIASVVICLFIARLGLRVIKVAFSQVVDQAADEETVATLQAIATKQPGVKHLDDLKTRMFGLRLFVDIEISVDPKLSVLEAHHIAHLLHDEIETTVPNVKHCMIHVNPYRTGEID